MKAVIISGGNPPSKELFNDVSTDFDILICADKGADFLYKVGIIPDFIVGDCDSVNPEVMEFFIKKGCEFKRFPKDKDFTDTELAYKLAVEKKADEIIFLGCTGSRIDHVLGNIGILSRCLRYKIDARIIDDNNVVFFTDKPIRLEGAEGSYFSLQAFGEDVTDLTIENAKFPLLNYTLSAGDPRTISNEFKNTPVNLTFQQGKLLIILSHD